MSTHCTLYVLRTDGYIAARRFDSDFQDISALVRHAVGEDLVDRQMRLRKASGAHQRYIQAIDKVQRVVYTDDTSNAW